MNYVFELTLKAWIFLHHFSSCYFYCTKICHPTLSTFHVSVRKFDEIIVQSRTRWCLISGAYYCLNMGMIATSTFLCTIVVHIYFRGNGPMPKILRKVNENVWKRFFEIFLFNIRSDLSRMACSILSHAPTEQQSSTTSQQRTRSTD